MSDIEMIKALIAENEELKHAVSAGAAREWDLRSQVRNAKESRARVVLSNKALRKDAERYRWTSTDGNWVARMFGKWRAHTGEYGDASPTDWYSSREEAIDAAMSKEG